MLWRVFYRTAEDMSAPSAALVPGRDYEVGPVLDHPELRTPLDVQIELAKPRAAVHGDLAPLDARRIADPQADAADDGDDEDDASLEYEDDAEAEDEYLALAPGDVLVEEHNGVPTRGWVFTPEAVFALCAVTFRPRKPKSRDGFSAHAR